MYGDQYKSFTIVFVVLNPVRLMAEYQQCNLRLLNTDHASILYRQVQQSIRDSCHSLNSYEVPKHITMLDSIDAFSTQNCLLTSTLKLNRKALKQYFLPRIQVAYDSMSSRSAELEHMLLNALGSAPTTADFKLDFNQVADVSSRFISLTIDNTHPNNHPVAGRRFVGSHAVCGAHSRYLNPNFLYSATSSPLFLRNSNFHIEDYFGKELNISTLLQAKSMTELLVFLNTDALTVTDNNCTEGELIARDRQSMILSSNTAVLPKLQTTTASATDILLTGCTGFLGAHVLAQLLQDTSATIHCLIRPSPRGTHVQLAPHVEDARLRARIAAIFMRYHLTPCDPSRLKIVQGDLAMDMLGLSVVEFNLLALSVDCIFHIGILPSDSTWNLGLTAFPPGAHVNWLLDYRTARSTNVIGTLNILRLAVLGKLKTLHYCSTISVAADGDLEDAPLNEPHLQTLLLGTYNGYASSKFIAESLVARAMAAGVPCVVYRPGMITGHSLTGACNPTDYYRYYFRISQDSYLVFTPSS